MWEAEKNSHVETQTRYSGLREVLNRGQKLNAFDKVLGSKLKHDSFYSHVELDKIIIDESGNIEADSVKLVADEFRKLYGDDLLETKQVGKLPNGNPAQDKIEPLGFDAELKAARSQRELDLVLKKYNKN